MASKSVSQISGSRMIRFKLNGEWVRARVHPANSLLRVLRDTLELTGSKPGCEAGECGSCTVLLDGLPVTSCMVLAGQVEGREITTVEGLSNPRLDPIIASLVEEGAVQCGYCIPGFVVAARGLLRSTKNPSRQAIRSGLSGNICRCGGYSMIAKAVMKASRRSFTGGHKHSRLSR